MQPAAPPLPRRGIRFDWTLNLGHMLTILAIAGGGAAAWSSMQQAVGNLDTRLISVERTIANYSEVQSRVAEAKVRLDAQEEMQRTLVEAIRRINDRMNTIQSDTAAIRGRLEGQAP